MVALRKPKLTATQFLEWSAEQPGRYELENGVVIEMAAEQARHALTKHAATKALELGVKRAGLDCTVFPDGMVVVIDDGSVRLPDAAVQCSEVDPEATVLDRPVILVEVASPSSSYRDETQKLVEYFLIPSVQHYLLISPAQRLVIHFRRVEGLDKIETRFLTGGAIELAPPGFTVAVKDLLGEVDR